MKHTYYCVQSEYYKSGVVKAVIIRQKEAAEKPRGDYKDCVNMHAYFDWFESKADAEQFVNETKAESVRYAAA
jgi:hypothetical protein